MKEEMDGYINTYIIMRFISWHRETGTVSVILPKYGVLVPYSTNRICWVRGGMLSPKKRTRRRHRERRKAQGGRGLSKYTVISLEDDELSEIKSKHSASGTVKKVVDHGDHKPAHKPAKGKVKSVETIERVSDCHSIDSFGACCRHEQV